MFDLDDLNVPQGQPGYLSKSAIAEILKNECKIEYSASQLKKIKREDLINELKDKIQCSKSEKVPEKSKKLTFRGTLNRIFSIFRY